MYKQINQRLAELDQEFDRGNARLLRLERERTELKETLFKIQGAILVLKDLAADAGRHNGTENPAEESAEICIPVAAGDEATIEEKHPQSIEE